MLPGLRPMQERAFYSIRVVLRRGPGLYCKLASLKILDSLGASHFDQADQARGKSHRPGGQRRMACLRQDQLDPPEPFVHSEVVRQAAAEELGETKAETGLAAGNRFAVSQVRAGDPP